MRFKLLKNNELQNVNGGYRALGHVSKFIVSIYKKVFN